MRERSPIRIVLDAQLRVPLSMNVVSTARENPTWIFAAPQASAMAEKILRDKGVEVFRVAAKDGKLDLAQILKILAERGITRLMVEGGPRVAASFRRRRCGATRPSCSMRRRRSARTASTRWRGFPAAR